MRNFDIRNHGSVSKNHQFVAGNQGLISGNPAAKGMTLVEVLVALSITLLILLGMTQAFTVASREIGIGRNRLLVAERVRGAADLIREDLERLSLNVRPTMSSTEGLGYLSIVDGPYRDLTLMNTPSLLVNTPSNLVGDIDDILLFTAVSPDQPFKGRFDGRIIESHEAEIIYFTRHQDTNGNGLVDYGEQIRLYRRVLLIRPDLTPLLQINNANNVIFRSVQQYNNFVGMDPVLMARTPYAKFLQFNDISLSWNPSNGPMSAAGPAFNHYRANSLGLLSNPKNRTAHMSALPPPLVAFPHPVMVNATPAERMTNVILQDLVMEGTMAGSDVVMENVVGFDIKVFDPTVPVFQYAGQPLLPHDPGYRVAFEDQGTFPPQGFGAYVDLGAFEYRGVDGTLGIVNNFPSPIAHHFAHWRHRLVDAAYQSFRDEEPADNGYWDRMMTTYENYSGGPVYTTWTKDFEYDGLDNDGDGLVDEGSNGIPRLNSISGIRNDRDSAPPYIRPVTSLQVTLRAASFDADRQQIRGSDQVIQAQIVVSTINQ